MAAPVNKFKAAMARDEQLIGLWMGMAEPYTAELCAQFGYDWLLIDGEHGPNDLRTIMMQLQVLNGYQSLPVVRPPSDDRILLKQYLDIGVQSFLIPMIESGEQAQEVVRSVRYPPNGVRGVGAGLARASAFNTTPDYLTSADDEICVLLQVETRAGVAAIEDIAAVEGVDGIFVGPVDLAADIGYLGKPGVPEVQAVVEDAFSRIKASGKASGILTSDVELAQSYKKMGANFLAVGSDIGVFGSGLKALKNQFS